MIKNCTIMTEILTVYISVVKTKSTFVVVPVSAKSFMVIANSKVLKIAEWEKRCAAQDGRLASINNAEDQKAAEAVLKKTKIDSHAILIAFHRNSKQSKQFVNAKGRAISFR